MSKRTQNLNVADVVYDRAKDYLELTVDDGRRVRISMMEIEDNFTCRFKKQVAELLEKKYGKIKVQFT
jgi:hypothetical protein